jgi:SAM-dependent methyltransferase
MRRRLGRNRGIVAYVSRLRTALSNSAPGRLLRIPRRVAQLEAQQARTESLLFESFDRVWERSRVRWRGVAPDHHLTWGRLVGGRPFMTKVAEYGGLGPTRTVVEIGPGYGRLLRACIDSGEAFQAYRGIDLSSNNVAYLRERFPLDNISFVQADVETVELDEDADTVISSLTFKHLFPSFQRALENVVGQLAVGGQVIFDLREGDRRYFEDDTTYIREYTREEVEAIVASAGLELTAFDEVQHVPGDPRYTRLLVVARRPG